MKIFINNIELEVSPESTILECCSSIGIDLPRFCYHQELSVAGNCRMCLVEIEKSPKPVAACAMPVSQNMKIFTDTPLVQKAREGVLELLLLNHPLDCPICDQGGECDLQEQVYNFGSDKSRFYEKKRQVEDKNCGPLIKTIMTRCIHCTRCVRFASEISGIELEYLGTVNRGQQTEITPFVEKIVSSELSGNLIDLCPVGALTSKPYAFNARPWELKSVESIDIFDSLLTPIRIDYKGSQILRILPRLDSKNSYQEWITDKARFSYDGLTKNRLNNILVNDNSLELLNDDLPTNLHINWDDLYNELSNEFYDTPSEQICFVTGSSVESETLLALKFLAESFGISNICYDQTTLLDSNFTKNFTFNLELIDNSDLYILFGTNLRIEANLLNLRLQQNVKKRNITVISVGSTFKSTFPSNNFINLTFKEFSILLEGKHLHSKTLYDSKLPLIIYGSSILNRLDINQFSSTLEAFNKNINIFNQDNLNYVPTESNFVGNLNLGISPFSVEMLENCKILYLLHPSKDFLENINQFLKNSNFKPKIIYQSSHYPELLQQFINYYIPSQTFVEKNGKYFDIENRCKNILKVIVSKEYTFEDYKILQMLTPHFSNNSKLDFVDINKRLVELIPSSNGNFKKNFSYLNYFKGLKLNKTLLKPIIEDFYKTHIVSNSSTIMNECSISQKKISSNFLLKK